MNFDPNYLLASLVVSGAGFVALMYGKKQTRVPHMVAGLVLVIFPYFLSNPLVVLGVGAAFLALLWLAVRFGL